MAKPINSTSDGTGFSNVATPTITVNVNQPPVVADDHWFISRDLPRHGATARRIAVAKR